MKGSSRLERFNRSLLGTVGSGDAQKVQRLLAQGADVNARDDLGRPVLELAARVGDYAVTRELLERGAEIDRVSNYGTALTEGAEAGHVAIVRLLLDRGADVNRANGYTTPLISALKGAVGAEPMDLYSNMVSIQTQVVPNTPANRKAAEAMARADVAKVERTMAQQEQTRVADLRANGMQIVRLLLERRVDVNAQIKDGSTALMAAARTGSEAAVTLLIAHGARTDAKTADGQTFLMFAAQSHSATLVNLFLTHGSDVNARDERGYTALIMAVLSHNPEGAKSLVAQGADVNAKNVYGDTPLTMAETWQGSEVEMVQFLLDHGADPEMKDGQGRSPLQRAREYKNQALINLLKKAGARE